MNEDRVNELQKLGKELTLDAIEALTLEEPKTLRDCIMFCIGYICGTRDEGYNLIQRGEDAEGQGLTVVLNLPDNCVEIRVVRDFAIEEIVDVSDLILIDVVGGEPLERDNNYTINLYAPLTQGEQYLTDIKKIWGE